MLPGADIDSLQRLKKIIRVQKRKPRWDLEKLYAQRQKVHDSLEEKLSANVKVGMWKCSGTISRNVCLIL
jgi:hypothetical protein